MYGSFLESACTYMQVREIDSLYAQIHVVTLYTASHISSEAYGYTHEDSWEIHIHVVMTFE